MTSLTSFIVLSLYLLLNCMIKSILHASLLDHSEEQARTECVRYYSYSVDRHDDIGSSPRKHSCRIINHHGTLTPSSARTQYTYMTCLTALVSIHVHDCTANVIHAHAQNGHVRPLWYEGVGNTQGTAALTVDIHVGTCVLFLCLLRRRRIRQIVGTKYLASVVHFAHLEIITEERRYVCDISHTRSS